MDPRILAREEMISNASINILVSYFEAFSFRISDMQNRDGDH